MKKLLAKICHFFKKENLKKVANVAVNSGTSIIATQILAHNEVAKKNDEIIVSREITGALVKSTFVRRDNYEKILNDTAKNMDIDPSSPEFSQKIKTALDENPDFFLSFFDSVHNISDKETRQYWAAILKGELESPGKMSASVVDVLRKLDRSTAILFEKVLAFQCNNWFFYDMGESFPISINEQHQLTEHGLVLPMIFGQVVEIRIGKDGWGNFNCCGVKILVERVKGESNAMISNLQFTTTAFLLSQVVTKKYLPDKAYLARIARFVESAKPHHLLLGSDKMGEFRLWVSIQSGNHVQIDLAKPSYGIDFHFADDGKSVVVEPQKNTE